MTYTGWPLRLPTEFSLSDPDIPHAGERRDSPSIKLNVGGGKGHPPVEGWKIVDLRERTADIVLDIAKETLPFEDDSVDIIFCSHTLEHIYPQRLGHVLSEFHRVLRPQVGLLRISVPDMEMAIQAYSTKDYGFFEESDIAHYDSQISIGGLLASWFYSTRIFKDPELQHGDGHVHCFDYDYLFFWLRQTGFTKIWRSTFRQSVLPELRGKAFDRHQKDSLFVEAVK
jgi:predicted SAM-dependent methyltransferase